jgi:RNA polymerase sigma factor (sigma-70 family)
VGDDGDTNFQELLEDMQAPEPQEELVRMELKSLLDRLMDMLTDRQRQILRLHYGMEDGTCYSLEQIGLRLNLSKERVRQVEHQATQRMKAMGADLGLEDFLE